jgi:hypothetical protein
LTKFIEKCANRSKTTTSGPVPVMCPDASTGSTAELITPQEIEGSTGVPNSAESSSSRRCAASSRIRNSAMASPVTFSVRSAWTPASTTVGWLLRPR